MKYSAFPQQADFHKSPARIRAAFAGKRGGKTEAGAIEGIIFQETKPAWIDKGVDPYLGIVLAPTYSMLKNLSMQKLLAYAQPFIKKFYKTDQMIEWHDGSHIVGISADRPERIEGLKANWAWMDEALQMKRQVFLELMARVSDQQGHIWLTSSLGVQYTNPKMHWAYELLKEKPIDGSEVFEWSTADNPYYPHEELERLKDTLDPTTYKQMFTISWDVMGTAAVYSDFADSNVIRGYTYNPQFKTIISVDWGWTHPMAACVFQYDAKNDTVYLFDEFVHSKKEREALWDWMKTRPYRIDDYICDIAGTQMRESATSNVLWFKEPPRNIHFKYRKSEILYGIPIVRSYIMNTHGQRRFYIDEVRCPKSIDGVKNYSYPEKDGIIQDENPVKKDDDAVDAIRYFFVNYLDPNRQSKPFDTFSRWRPYASSSRI